MQMHNRVDYTIASSPVIAVHHFNQFLTSPG